jgi:hypothetical protein
MSQSPERRLAYFALDVPHKGQASHIHISEIVNNLRRLGWRVDCLRPSLQVRAVPVGRSSGSLSIRRS